jgi:fibro-slime domain-containing protein
MYQCTKGIINTLLIVTVCLIFTSCSWANGQSIYLTGTIRKFETSSTDFNLALSSADTAVEVVQTALGSNGKPVYAGNGLTSITDAVSFNAWFADVDTDISGTFSSYTLAMSAKANTNGAVFQFDEASFFPLGNTMPFFTYEIKTRLTVVSGISLTLASSDDLWMFINGKLAIDNGGIHTSSSKTLDLSVFASANGISVGATVDVAIFAAHRSSQHNPSLRIEMVNPGICNAEYGGTRSTSIYPFSSANVVLNSGAPISFDAAGLALLSPGSNAVSAAAWHSSRLFIQNGFVAEYEFRMRRSPNNGGGQVQGMAFVMQNVRNNVIGGSGLQLGYNIEKSIAIEFDTNQDTAALDPNDKHISVHTRYADTNTASHTAELITNSGLSFPLLTTGSDYHKARVVFNPATSSVAPTITVFINDNVVITEQTLDEAQVASVFSGTTYLGFTSSSDGAHVSDIDVRNWKVWLVAPSGPRSTVAPSVPSTMIASASATSATTFTVTAHDACGAVYSLDAGSVTAYLAAAASPDVPIANTADVTNNADGTFVVSAHHTVIGNYKLSIKLNGQHVADSPFDVTIVAAAVSAVTSTFSGDSLTSVRAGEPVTLVVVARDAFGNLQTDGSLPFTVQYSSGVVETPTSSNGAQYNFTYTTRTAGTFSLFVRVNNADISGSPVSGVQVLGGIVAGAPFTTAIGDGLQSGTAGGTSTFSVTPRDTYGNVITVGGAAISCLFQVPSTPSKNFSCSAASFSNGVYVVTYSTTEAGTYIGSVKINNLFVTSVSSLVIGAGELNGTKSDIATPGLGTANSISKFTIQARDTFKNNRNDPNPAGKPFVVQVNLVSPATSYSATCDIASSNAISLECSYRTGGQYEFTFTPQLIGTYLITATQGSDQLLVDDDTDPGAHIVQSASISAAKSEILAPLANATAGEVQTVFLRSRDSLGNLRVDSSDDSSLFFVTVRRDNNVVGEVNSVARQSGASYKVLWSAQLVGSYTMTVEVGGDPILFSGTYSAASYIAPASTNASMCQPFGAGWTAGISQATAEFSVRARDSYGNVQITASDIFEVTVNPAEGASPSVSFVANGVYKVQYTVPEYKSDQNTYTLTLTHKATVGGISSLVGTADAAIARDNNASYAIVDGPGVNSAIAGTDATFIIADSDSQGNLVVSSSEQTFAVSIVSDNTAVSSTSVMRVSPSSGNFSVTYRASIAGTYSLSILSYGVVATQGSPYTLVVQPGAISPPNCIVNGLPATATSGFAFEYTIVARDSNLNVLSTSELSLTVEINPSNTQFDVAPVVTPISGGSYRVSFTPKTAGSFGIKVQHNAASLGPSGEYQVTVVAGIPFGPTSTMNNPASSTAGVQTVLTLQTNDANSNPVLSQQTLALAVTLTNNPGMSFSYSYTSSGQYQIVFTPTKAVASGQGTIDIQLGGQSIQNSPFAIVVVATSPAPDNSTVIGLDGVVHRAGTPIGFTVTLKDQYGNVFDGGIDRVTVAGPTNGDNTGLAGFNVGALGNGQYSVSFETDTASATVGGTPYTFGVQVRGVFLTPPGLVAITVLPAVATPSMSIVPPLVPSIFNADVLQELNVTLRDQFRNIIYTTTDSVTVQFYSNPACDTADDSIDSSTLISSRFAIGGAPVVNPDGVHTIRIRTQLTGVYVLNILVNGAAIQTKCSKLTRFTVKPDVANGAKSVLVGASGATAGTSSSFSIELRDRFDNRLDSGGQNIQVGSAPSVGPAVACVETSTVRWFASTNGVGGLNVIDNTDGSFTVQFGVLKSGTFKLVLTVNGEFIGNNPQSCSNYIVSPSYVADFFSTLPSTAISAIPSAFDIFSRDLYGNNVTRATSNTHTFSVSFRRNSTGESLPVVYSFAGDIIQGIGNDVAQFLSSWAGQFATTIQIADASNDGKPRNRTSVDGTISILPATCNEESAATSYRCPSTGACVAAHTSCPNSISCGSDSQVLCASTGTCQEAPCSCPSGTVLCATTGGHCVSVLSDCPLSQYEICPTTFPHKCTTTGVCRKSSADCPSPRQCPSSLQLCPDGMSCAASIADCFAPINGRAVCSGTLKYRCADGACAASLEGCTTQLTCKSSSDIVCPDGSCQSSKEQCASVYKCYGSTPFRCSDGSCRASGESCPSSVVCPFGHVRCETGECALTNSACPTPVPNIQTCSLDTVRCPTGECRPNLRLCGSPVSCPSNQPILCETGECATSQQSCRSPVSCPLHRPTLCASTSSCVSLIQSCPTPASCDDATPVRCADGSCVAASSECLHSVQCPAFAPVRCADGSCTAWQGNCATFHPCASNTPVRCADGKCAVAREDCVAASNLACKVGSIRCPSGSCALSYSLCPTALTCSAGYVRCNDGSCRSSCPSETVITEVCPAVQCPRSFTGVSCASSLAECPLSTPCPADRPVKCIDATCRASQDQCPSPPELYNNRVACPSGTFSTGILTCGTPTTCPPSMPHKCYDESCRKAPQDCPQPKGCPAERPFLCADGSCEENLALCPTMSRCASGTPVKCPAFTSNAGCVASVSECADSTVDTTVRFTCPHFWTQRCRDGSCHADASSCPSFECPAHLPFLCSSGVCSTSAVTCPIESNGCPTYLPHKCTDGSCSVDATGCGVVSNCTTESNVRCADGSCAATPDECPQENGCPIGAVRCFDSTCVFESQDENQCTASTTSPNTCPASRPYRCSDGYCAVSSLACPIVPPDQSPCDTSSGMFVRCASGYCASTAAQCPHVSPCDSGSDRCGDGSCRVESSLCPAANTCPDNFPYRCSNGRCAVSSSKCINDQTGCPADRTKCPLNGKCVFNQADCLADNLPGTGCASAIPFKCWNGECRSSALDCPLENGCAVQSPFRCKDGSCASSSANCATFGGSTCPNVTCAATGLCATAVSQCTAASLCPIQTPVRCADGSCRKYSAAALLSGQFLSNTSLACTPTVVCNPATPYRCLSGSCVSDPAFCRPVHPCLNGAVLCPDKHTCAATLELCTHKSEQGMCPPSSPVLCNDGSCRISALECPTAEQMQGSIESCAVRTSLDTPVLCFDGSCRRSGFDCIQTRSLADSTAVSPVALNANGDVTQACGTGLKVCWDGSCMPSLDDCALQPACHASRPVRCGDGSCVANAATCNDTVTALTCSNPSNVRCTDGTCRSSQAECPATAGCPLSAPFACPLNANMPGTALCVATAADCATTISAAVVAASSTIPLPCDGEIPRQTSVKFGGVSKCLRDIHPQVHVITALSFEDASDIAIVVDSHSHLATMRMSIPSGALSTSAPVSTIAIRPVAPTELFDVTNNVHATRVSDFGFTLSYAQSVLSSVFSCKTDKTGELFYPLEVHGLIDRTSNHSSVTVNSADVCLAYVETTSFGKQWTCVETTYADRTAFPAHVNDGQPIREMRGRIDVCTDASSLKPRQYAFILSPLRTPPAIASTSESVWDRYQGAILGGSIGGVLFIAIAGLLVWRLGRYRVKYKAEQERTEKLRNRALDLDENYGGLGVAGDDIEMQINPMVVQVADLNKQIDTLNEQTGVSSEADHVAIQALSDERARLQDDIKRTRAEYEWQQARATGGASAGATNFAMAAPSAGAGAAAAAAAATRSQTTRRPSPAVHDIVVNRQDTGLSTAPLGEHTDAGITLASSDQSMAAAASSGHSQGAPAFTSQRSAGTAFGAAAPKRRNIGDSDSD